MKKIISILALVLAMTMMLSITSFAAASFTLAEGATVPSGTTVTPAADRIAASTAATSGAYYGILLVEGDALPTVDSDILYIDQKTASSATVDFSVLPIIPEAGTELTLYISSSVEGEDLIAIPLVYDEEKAEYVLGDVYEDGKVNISDATMTLNAYLENITLSEKERLAADVYPKNAPDDKINISDFTLILNVYLENDTLN